MRPKPYIGITGFMTGDEVDKVLDALSEDTDRLVMIGGLVSSKTLRHEPNKWPQRYPSPDKLCKIFRGYRNLLNLIHFNTKEPEKLFDDMCLAQDLAGPNCHGFQLNIAWPDKRVLERYKKYALFHHKTIVLQCGGNALREVGSPFNLGLRLRDYEGLVDYVLVDPSGGLGKEFDPGYAQAAFYYILQNAINPSSIGLGIAGGLHAGNLDCLRKLMPEFEFSIDAEGKLRDKEDHLDIAAAQAYLKAADALYREHKKAA